MAKKIPYGLTDYFRIVTEDFYYVDKTKYIEDLEKTAAFLFLIRPRRFGKSLFLNMLNCYYDVKYADRFEELFGNQYIGKHPTAEQGKYLVLRFNFSMVRATDDKLEAAFNRHISLETAYFASVYASYFKPDFQEQLKLIPEAAGRLEYICLCAKEQGLSIYLLIDEYDNFTNTILSSKGNDVYHSLTHDSGFYRSFFNVVKGVTTGAEAPVKRMFITGVSPVTLDDVTSGFNIGTNITTDEQFNSMVGFSGSELQEMLSYYESEGMLVNSKEELVRLMKPWYDNYCFAEESLERDPKMFNCDMVFYYLRHYMTLGKSPKEMIDPNTRTDYNKMKKLIRLDKLDGNRKGVLRKITEDGQIVTTLTTTFPATDITKPEIFPSLLFYYGMLTITATRGNYLVLSIPNNNVRKQYYEFLLEEYQDNRHINLNDLGLMYYEMAYDGHWRETLEFIAHAYKENSSVRNAIEGERNLQGFFTAYLSTNAYYLIAPEVELNHGYCDLFLMPDLIRYDVKHSYIIELKYLSVKDSEAKAEAQWKEAVEQIKGYAAGPKVRRMIYDTELHCIVMQFRGWELERMEEVR